MILQKVDKAFIDRFESLTKRDLSGFIRDYILFMDNNYQNIYDYIKGNLSRPDVDSFKEFFRLDVELDVILASFESYKRFFYDVQSWNTLEILENIDEFFKTTKKLNRYLQTSIAVSSYQDGVRVDYAANIGQDMKFIERDVSGSKDYSNSWIDLGIDNLLNEEDYNLEESYSVKIPFSRDVDITIDVIFNPIESVNDMYGKDVDIEMIFENGDWRIISGKGCLIQGATIKMHLVKGDNPLYPNLGLPKGLIGSNRTTLSFPIITRSYGQVFSSDDRFTKFSISNVKLEQDGLFLEADIQSKANDSIELIKLLN